VLVAWSWVVSSGEVPWSTITGGAGIGSGSGESGGEGEGGGDGCRGGGVAGGGGTWESLRRSLETMIFTGEATMWGGGRGRGWLEDLEWELGEGRERDEESFRGVGGTEARA
jgi:hypothetical protein